MITRMWRGLAKPETADQYVRHLETAIFPELASIDGYRGAELLRRDVEAGVEFVVLTRWESLTAIREFAGEAIDTAAVPPEAQALLAEWDTSVKHYEVVG